MEREAFDDRSVGVVADVRGGRPLLVAFGGIASGLGMPPFEFVRLVEHLACDVIFVRDPLSSFYLRGTPGLGRTFAAMADGLARWTRSAPRCVFVGNSAGAYAALAVGSLAGPDMVVAFTPVTFLGRRVRLRYGDRRWRREVRSARRGAGTQRRFLDLRRAMADAGRVEAAVYYPARTRLDRVHAERLRDVPGVSLMPQDRGGHAMIRAMRDDGSLVRILGRALVPQVAASSDRRTDPAADDVLTRASGDG